jgi:hypothetical protein
VLTVRLIILGGKQASCVMTPRQQSTHPSQGLQGVSALCDKGAAAPPSSHAAGPAGGERGRALGGMPPLGD